MLTKAAYRAAPRPALLRKNPISVHRLQKDRKWKIITSVSMKPRVAAYMHDLDEELWKLGVPAKTKHNEVAPAQHELAPVFDTVKRGS